MNNPTNEQAAVLDAQDRVRIVRAAPGCGKTWLVAEAIRRMLTTWTGCGGIAALSFTNVGGHEIRRAVGSDLSHPHFVGTLDAFAYRFVVRQFAHILEPNLRRARLVPADQAGTLSHDPRTAVILPNHNNQQSVSLFDITFTGGIRDQATLALRVWGQPIPLSPSDCAVARAAKFKLWRDHHWLSHSDVTYIAAAILRDQVHGQRICKLVSTRFPFLVVDELQDTGWYLSEIVRDLLSVDKSKGLLVGDPDQAIYQFNGARPELCDTFTQIAGSREFPVRRSIRCPLAVTTVANHLKSGAVDVEPRSGDPGNAILIIADNPAETINAIRLKLGQVANGRAFNVVVRKNDTVEEIDGGKLPAAPKFSSRPLTMVHDGVRHLIAGRTQRAIESSIGAILYVLFGQPTVFDAMLDAASINPHRLRVVAAALLETSKNTTASESSLSWGERVKEFILQAIAAEAWVRPDQSKPTIKAPPKNLQNHLVSLTFSRLSTAPFDATKIPVRTVHGVKGETHDLTIFYVPQASQGRPCISDVWWSSDPSHSEERRIAFVAVTRSRQDFILCVTPATAQNLRNTRSNFYQCFVVFTAAAFLLSLPEAA